MIWPNPSFSNIHSVALLVGNTPPTRMRVRPPVLAQASTYACVCVGVSTQGNGAENEGLANDLYIQCDLAVGILWCNSPVYVHQSKSLIPCPSEPLSFTAQGKPSTSAPIMCQPPPPHCCRSTLQCVSNPARVVWICGGIIPLSRAAHLSHFLALRA